MIAHTAESVLKYRFIGYTTPLKLARDWARSGEARYREQSLALLEGLFKRYPHSLEIAQELVLAYLEAHQDDTASAVLDQMQLLMRTPHEELLARRGRIFRDKGDEFVKYPAYAGPREIKIGGEVDHPAEALRYYTLGLEQYTQSYQVRKGHYPGVNVATLHLLVAATTANDSERQAERARSQSVAKELSARMGDWPRDNDDDDVWHAASKGELHLLRQEWVEAAKSYHDAQKSKHCQDFHRISMLKQVIRITHCYRRLEVGSMGAFDDLTSVFLPKTAEDKAFPVADGS